MPVDIRTIALHKCCVAAYKQWELQHKDEHILDPDSIDAFVEHVLKFQVDDIDEHTLQVTYVLDKGAIHG